MWSFNFDVKVYERILRNIYERAGLVYVNDNKTEMEEDPNFDSLTIEELRSRLLKCQKVLNCEL